MRRDSSLDFSILTPKLYELVIKFYGCALAFDKRSAKAIDLLYFVPTALSWQWIKPWAQIMGNEYTQQLMRHRKHALCVEVRASHNFSLDYICSAPAGTTLLFMSGTPVADVIRHWMEQWPCATDIQIGACSHVVVTQRCMQSFASDGHCTTHWVRHGNIGNHDIDKAIRARFDSLLMFVTGHAQSIVCAGSLDIRRFDIARLKPLVYAHLEQASGFVKHVCVMFG